MLFPIALWLLCGGIALVAIGSDQNGALGDWLGIAGLACAMSCGWLLHKHAVRVQQGKKCNKEESSD